jgi:hypothetical protein
MMEWTRDLPVSRSYLIIVISVAVVVGGLAVFGQSSTLALAAAVLGLYVLHLFSNWQLASNQRKQWQTLREVERMLGALEEQEPDAGSEPARDGGRPGSAAADAAAPAGGGSAAAAGEPPGSSSDQDPGTAVGEEGATAAEGEAADGRARDGEAAEPRSATPRNEELSPGEQESGAESEEPGEFAVDEVPSRTEQTDETGGEDDEAAVFVPRHYKLGTVAVVQRVLSPAAVARVAAVQERHPDQKFGDIAVRLDFLTESELEELLETQRRGLYRPEAIRRARDELKKFRRQKARELGTGP